MTSREDIESIRKHAVWATIADLRERVRVATPQGSTDRETLARIEAVLSYAGAYKSFGAHLFPSTWGTDFSNLNTYLAYVGSNLDDWNQSAPMPRSVVTNIDSYLDNVLTILTNFASLQKESRARVIAEVGDSYRIAAEASLNALQTQISELREKLETAETKLNDSLAEAQAARQATDDAKQEITQALAEADDRAKTALDDRMTDFKSRSTLHYNQVIQQADEVIAGMHLKEEEAKGLLQVVADASVAGGYQKYATREQKAFQVWNTIGLSIAAVVAVYLGIRFWNIEELTIQESIVRAAISLPGLAVAGYCLRQAGLRQKEAIEAKYRELDLIALPPFTDAMDEQQKSELRMLLGRRIFGKSVQQAAEGKSPEASLPGLSVDDIAKLVQTFRG